MAPNAGGCLCHAVVGRRPVPRAAAQAWRGLRLLARAARPRPSRMVLADQVHRPPQARRAPADGPFGGMNRRVANVDAAPAARAPRGAAAHDRRRDARRERAREDRRALNMQRALAIVTYGERASFKERMQRFESFDQFDLLPSVQRAVAQDLFKGMVDVRPTPVQRLAIPALLGQPSPQLRKARGRDVESFLLAAETGSGKTLAYLLPAIDALKVAESEDPDIKAYKERQHVFAGTQAKPFDEPHPTMARPKVVVLVPSAELAQQVVRVAKSLSHVVKFKTEILSSDLKPQMIQRNIYSPRGLDVVVATPHLLASMAESDPNILSQVSHLVIDEADSLLDRSFSPVTTSIIQRATPSVRQLVCCSATIPKRLNNFLALNYPKMMRITTPNLHAIPRRVQMGVIDVSKAPYQNNKDLACADVIHSIGKEASLHEGPVRGMVDVRRILVFVNERAKTEQVADYLRTKGIDAEALHRDATEKRHDETLGVFTSAEPLRIRASHETGRKRALTNVKVLVVTDLASRGIDTVAVRHVVLYDVPHTTIDFIHRLGRAGRMGRRGRAIVLVGNGDRKDVVAEVKRSMFMGQALI